MLKWIKTAILLAVFGLFQIAQAAPRYDFWRIVPIASFVGADEIHCTASLFKFATGCALVTNYHCVPGKIEPQVFAVAKDRSEESKFNELIPSAYQLKENVPLKIKKRNSDLDLAELELSPDLKRVCETELSPVVYPKANAILAKGALSLATEGYVFDSFHRTYSQYQPWAFAQGYSSVKTYQRSANAKDIFFETSDLKIIPGMSGGVAYTRDWNPIGINSELIPFENVAFIVPMERVEDFVAQGENFIDPRTAVKAGFQLSNGSHFSGGNGHGGGGGNGHGGGGGNGHAGGANSHSVTESDLVVTANDVHGTAGSFSLMQFMEPLEGVPLEEEPTRILLGVNGKQIDGMDDYERRYEPVKKESPKLITRPAEGYPDESVRKTILNRLAGLYHAKDQSRTHESLYVASLDHPDQWVINHEGSAPTYIFISVKTGIITLHLGAHTLSNPMNLTDPVSEPEENVYLHATLSEDAKTVFLTNLKNEQIVYQCDNRNYLKLNCRWRGFLFSISAERESTSVTQGDHSFTQLSFRMVNPTFDEAKHAFVDFRFGNLLGSNEEP